MLVVVYMYIYIFFQFIIYIYIYIGIFKHILQQNVFLYVKQLSNIHFHIALIYKNVKMYVNINNIVNIFYKYQI